ncbi:MAG: methionine gamma-lyase family protein [Oscillospiraceae bacterium]|jgi:cystathionine beta-lyase family protein involved in aluminum resistance|nr:methionine gamma-lyase family protein [Oscillospiraceae bacterium]
MIPFYNIDPAIEQAAEKAQQRIAPIFSHLEAVAEYNQLKVLKVYQDNDVTESCFYETTGYAYGDRGRETLDKCFAQAMGAEAALIRHSFACGTHAIATAFFGVLRPGDTLLCVTGKPYDTLHGVIGIGKKPYAGSLADFGIQYSQVDLTADGKPDLPAIAAAIQAHKPKAVHIQRSRGYTLRRSLSVAAIGEITATVQKSAAPASVPPIIIVDNCYGEFVETLEPTAVGADLIVGSLIKNAGGGVAKNGGYIAGRDLFVQMCANRLTCPGLGSEVGANLGHMRDLFMGLFHAPHVTGEALKTAVFAAALFEELGFGVTPTPEESRADIIQAILLDKPERLIAFCQGLQKGSPVDSRLTPEPWDMPGYESQVIMAAGAFIFGSSIELSADAPLREPYAVWMQGGLNYPTGKLGVLLASQAVHSLL